MDDPALMDGVRATMEAQLFIWEQYRNHIQPKSKLWSRVKSPGVISGLQEGGRGGGVTSANRHSPMLLTNGKYPENMFSKHTGTL